MADVFISYRRIPSAALAHLIREKLNNQHGIDAYLDTAWAGTSNRQFSDRLMQAIADAPVFICLLAETTLESEWVLKEIEEAYRLRKLCLPIFQESYRPLTNAPAAVDYLLSFDGVHILDQKSVFIDESVQKMAAQIRTSVSQIPSTDKPNDQQRSLAIAMTLLTVTVFMIIVTIILITQKQPDDNLDDAIITTSVAALITETLTTSSVSPRPTTSYMASATINIINLQVTQTELALQATVDAIETQNADLFATRTQIAQQQSADAQATTNQQATQDAQAMAATQHAQSASTQNAQATATNYAPLQLALDGVSSNEEWQYLVSEDGYIRDFDSVDMVLVPAGKFMMGSDYGDDDERPTHEIEIEQPFWIDRYEVTNEQYGSVGCHEQSSRPNQPHNCINWINAQAHCEARGGRLPTEAEWEYAARGPNALRYPWGTTFSARNVVHGGNSSGYTADIGSYPSGKSWVGALDMSGNVWEWTLSEYRSYPYSANDGRNSIIDINVNRVLRGSSFDYTDYYLRSAFRGWNLSQVANNDYGFRCVRDYE